MTPPKCAAGLFNVALVLETSASLPLGESISLASCIGHSYCSIQLLQQKHKVQEEPALFTNIDSMFLTQNEDYLNSRG